MAKIKGVADITILLDVTGSMQPCIDALRENIKEFFSLLEEGDANNSPPVKDWRARVVGYRDVIHDKDKWFVENDFVTEVSALYSQLDAMDADGGGDEPESLLDALHRCASAETMSAGAQEIDPRAMRAIGATTRVLIVFTDATYHQVMSYPAAKGGAVGDVNNLLMNEKIILIAFHPEIEGFEGYEASKKGLGLLPKADMYAYSSKYPELTPQEALVAFTQDKESFSKMLQAMAKTVSVEASVEIIV